MMARSSMGHPWWQKILTEAQRSSRRCCRLVLSSQLPRAAPLGLGGLGGDALGLAEEGLEALASLRLAGEIAGRSERLGTFIGCEQALQAERLLDAERRQFVAGLRHLQGAVGGA